MGRILIVDTIIEKDGKILMLRRNFEPGKGKLDLLGGFVESNETIEKAAVREAKEESGFDVELIEKLAELNYFERDEKTTHAFIGKIIGGKLRASEEGEPLWISFDDLKAEDIAFPMIGKLLDIYKKYREA
ncbi:MAG: NUDIX domain-containing protein [Candidatus Aenigmatarchaeota archaeon]